MGAVVAAVGGVGRGPGRAGGGRAHPHALVGVDDRAGHGHQGLGVGYQAGGEPVGRLAQPQALGVGAAACREQGLVAVGGPQAQMGVEPVAGLVGEGLGHEGGVAPVPLGQGVDHQPEQDQPVGGGHGVGVLPVLLVLAVGVLMVVGVVGPAHGVEVLGHRGEVGQHPGQPPGVVAGLGVAVALIGHADLAVLAPHHQRVLGLESGLEHQIAGGQRLQRVAQDHPGGVRPRLALHGRVALHGRHVGLPRQLGVGGRVGQGQYVGAGRVLADGAGREPGEPGAVGHEPVERLDRHQLGARLAVHLHEHGVDELHAVRLDPRPDLCC